jgi:hypothetical protein
MAPTIAFTTDFIDACRNLWRDGYDKGVVGNDDYPDFTVFFNNIKHSSTKATKEEHNYAEMEKLPFNRDQCEARVEKYGYAIQCTRAKFGDGCLCKTHQNMFDKFGAIRYGRFNEPRTENDLITNDPIKWGPKKSRVNKSQEKDTTTPKIKVGEMRDYLSSRVPVDDFRGLKKAELTELYLKVKAKENASSSEEENTPPAESPKKEEKLPESTKSSEATKSSDSTESTDDGAGVGLHLIPETPKTVAEYKQLFKELSIETDGLKGLRAYKQAYQDYLREKEEEKTQPMSDDEDDIDDLQEDKNSYEEMTFEGISYLEDEDSGKIYNLRYQHVGKWNEDVDDIIWISDEFRLNHESARQ